MAFDADRYMLVPKDPAERQMARLQGGPWNRAGLSGPPMYGTPHLGKRTVGDRRLGSNPLDAEAGYGSPTHAQGLTGPIGYGGAAVHRNMGMGHPSPGAPLGLGMNYMPPYGGA